METFSLLSYLILHHKAKAGNLFKNNFPPLAFTCGVFIDEENFVNSFFFPLSNA
jgi:hypothetical protein